MSKFIQFKHAQAGEIPVNGGVTPLCDLLTIGALVCTAKPAITGKRMPLSRYETDLEGLEFLRDRSSEIINYLQKGIETIGVLLACNGDTLFDSQISDVGDLIAGLSELARLISDEHVEFNHSFLVAKAQCNTKQAGPFWSAGRIYNADGVLMSPENLYIDVADLPPGVSAATPDDGEDLK